MEQRRLRLGDILDDYCPRERRVTNHAVVAMIEEDVKQTRCTTCDAEHAYKGGKAPRKRRKETAGAPILTDPVVAPDTSEPFIAAPDDSAPEDASAEFAPEVPVTEDVPDTNPPPVEEGPVHRPLIRATLPRPEGQKEARPLPEFTVRNSGNRTGNGNYRDARVRQRGTQGGNNPRSHGGQRFAGPRGNRGPGGGRPATSGFRPSQQPRHGGKKRSR